MKKEDRDAISRPSRPPARGGRRPFGYGADGLHLDEREAKALREAAGAVLAGTAVSAIAEGWNATGPSTVSGVPWSASTLRRILLSGRIAGWIERGGRLVGPAPWPGAIDLQTHLQLRAALDPAATRARSYLLSGLVTCGACGAPMAARPVVQDGRARRRYVCDRRRAGCGRVGIDADRLEDHVAGLASTRPVTAASQPGRVAILEARLEELADLFATGQIDRREWLMARARVVEGLEQARRELADTGAGRPGEGPFRLRALRLRRQVAAVMVSPRRGGNRFDPARIQVTWHP